jgi:hypothetical protein
VIRSIKQQKGNLKMSEYLNEVANAIQAHNNKKKRGSEVTIKMSEAFDLPVTGLMSDDLKIDCDIEKAELYTIAAINAYDANQERIAELNEFRAGLLRCVKSQREEIAALKQSLQIVKADTLNDLVEVLRETGPPNQIEASVRTHNSICNSIEGVIKIMREGKS